MPSQRPFFLSSFIAAFRPQGPTIQATASQQPNKHAHQTSSSPSSSSHHTYSTSSAVAAAAAAANSRQTSSSPIPTSSSPSSAAQQSNSVSIHSPRGASHSIPIPGGAASNRRRGSDSSSEGFKDVIGADKWYIGGRMAGGEEKFFKLGVVRRVRSNDGLSLDRLSL
ncbi:hypothetical protein LIA77_07753 [Sarocladium implicatum]|nr:hypothetical protein LIA77_07753 [Sarocladium implicatum]